MQSEPSRHTLTLPLVNPDEENICLPLVINVISKYWGEEISLVDTEQIAKKYSGIKGSIMIEGIELAEKHGLKGYVYRGSVEDIKRKIDQGIPSIVILPGIHETVQHANIICGYDPDEGRILSYIPQPDTIGAIPETQFQRDWEQDDMTSIVLVPEDMKQIIEKQNPQYKESNRICLEVERLRHLRKVPEALEKLSRALRIDADNAQAWCIKGSILNKDFSQAEVYYSKAIGINPIRFGPIYKNRALVRLQRGDEVGCRNDLVKYLDQVPNAADRGAIEEALNQL